MHVPLKYSAFRVVGCLAAAAAVGMAAVGCSAHSVASSPLFRIIEEANFVPASTPEDFLALLANDPERVPVIRSAEDWARFCLRRSLKDHPLHDLSGRQLTQFTQSLRFDNGGLAGANYGPLRDSLSFEDFGRVWGAFGLDMGLFADYQDKECSKRATCTHHNNAVCTSNC